MVTAHDHTFVHFTKTQVPVFTHIHKMHAHKNIHFQTYFYIHTQTLMPKKHTQKRLQTHLNKHTHTHRI
jgi:hypothetical protein